MTLQGAVNGQEIPNDPFSLYELTKVSGFPGWIAFLIALAVLVLTIMAITKKREAKTHLKLSMLSILVICFGVSGGIYELYRHAKLMIDYHPASWDVDWSIVPVLPTWGILVGLLYGVPLLLINLLFKAIKSNEEDRASAYVYTVGTSLICVSCLFSALKLNRILTTNAARLDLSPRVYYGEISNALFVLFAGILLGVCILALCKIREVGR